MGLGNLTHRGGSIFLGVLGGLVELRELGSSVEVGDSVEAGMASTSGTSILK